MKVQNFIALFILALFINSSFSHDNNPVKIIEKDYEVIIHLDSTDYEIYREEDTRRVAVIEGISVGENYLLLWDVHTFYVYDINTYQFLAKIRPKYGVFAVGNADGKIYCASGHDLIIYTSFEDSEVYEINPAFSSLNEYKAFLNQGRVKIAPRHRERIIRIIYQDNSIYFEFSGHFFLSLNDDFVFDQDDGGKKYIFPKKFFESKPGKSNIPYLLNEGNLLEAERWPNEVESDYLFGIYNKNKSKVKEFKIKKPQKNNEKDIVLGLNYLFENPENMFFYFLDSKNRQQSEGTIVCYSKKNNSSIQIDLPVKNCFKGVRRFYYNTHLDNCLYTIAVNQDLSIDVLKVDLANE